MPHLIRTVVAAIGLSVPLAGCSRGPAPTAQDLLQVVPADTPCAFVTGRWFDTRLPQTAQPPPSALRCRAARSA